MKRHAGRARSSIAVCAVQGNDLASARLRGALARIGRRRGPQLFALVFGSVWTEAGRFAQFLALMTLGQLVVGPIAQTLTIFERQDLQLACDALRFAVLLLIFFAAHQLTWSPLPTIAVLSVAMTLCHGLLFVLTRRVLLTHLRARA